jgi:hypothetical protein
VPTTTIIEALLTLTRQHHASGTLAAAGAGVAARVGVAARAGTAARASRAGSIARRTTATNASRGRTAGKLQSQSLVLRSHGVVHEQSHWGDRSWTYSAPGRAWADRISVLLPATVARWSPLGSAIAADGVLIRAAFGSIAWIGVAVVFAGCMALGVQRHGLRSGLPVDAFVAVAVLGVIDAAMGLAGTMGLTISCALCGSLFSLEGCTSIVLIGTVSFGLTVMVGNLRLFTKDPPRHIEAVLERFGDVLIGSLLCGYLGYKFTAVLAGPDDALAPLRSSAATIGWILAASTALRYIGSTVIAHGYPQRLKEVTPTDRHDHHPRAWGCSVVLRGLIAGVVIVTFLGYNGTVMALIGLYVVDLIATARISPHERVRWWSILIPHNIGKILALTAAAALATVALRPVVPDPYQLALDSLVAVMVLTVAINATAARWEPRPLGPTTWRWIAGALLVGATVLQLSNHLIRG